MGFKGAATILGAAILLSTWFVTDTWRTRGSVLRVTGSAKQQIESNLGVLRLSLNASATQRSAALEQLETHRPIVLKFFKDRGVPENAIELAPPQVETVWEYDDKGYRTGRVTLELYRQAIAITLPDVQRIRDLSLATSLLGRDGVNIEVFQPEYLFTDLATVKVAIQALAAKDARERAQGIADATGAKLGVLRDARMGVLQITPLNSNVISDYGMNDTSSISKEVTAVVQATFEIS